MKKITSKTLKAPDKLLKTMLEFVGYLKHNVKMYLTLSVVIVLVTAVVVTTNYFVNKREENARRTLYTVTQQFQTLAVTDSSSAAKMLEEVLPKLGSTKAGLEARYMIAEMYYSKKDWDNALKNYDDVAGKASGVLKSLALMGSAYSKENKGDFKGALDSFTKLKDSDASVYKAVGMIGVGRCFQKLGDKNKALASYESVIIAYPDTDYARLASAAKADL